MDEVVKVRISSDGELYLQVNGDTVARSSTGEANSTKVDLFEKLDSLRAAIKEKFGDRYQLVQDYLCATDIAWSHINNDTFLS